MILLKISTNEPQKAQAILSLSCQLCFNIISSLLASFNKDKNEVMRNYGRN